MMKTLLLLVIPGCIATEAFGAPDVAVTRPDRKVRFTAFVRNGHLRYQATLKGQPVIEPSALGIAFDGVDLGQGASIGKAEPYRLDEGYPWRGVHSRALNHCNGARVSVTHAASRTPFTVDVRVFDDAVAFRHVVPGSGRRVPDAATSFRIPKGSVVWYHGLRDHYEGLHSRKGLEEIAAGDWGGPAPDLPPPGRPRLRCDHRGCARGLCRDGAPGRRPGRLR